jgi:hypothetical protein
MGAASASAECRASYNFKTEGRFPDLSCATPEEPGGYADIEPGTAKFFKELAAPAITLECVHTVADEKPRAWSDEECSSALAGERRWVWIVKRGSARVLRNGVAAPVGKPLPVVAWGGAVNVSMESPAFEMNCRTVSAGTLENLGKTGSEYATGETQTSAYYECHWAKCEAEVAASELGKLGFKGLGFIQAYNLPWKEELVQMNKTENGLQIGAPPNFNFGKGFPEGPAAKSQEPDGKGTAWGRRGAMGLVTGCEVVPNPEAVTGKNTRVLLQYPFEGDVYAKVGGKLNEGGNASKPAKMEFKEKESGELELEGSPGTGATFRGQLKYLGYTIQDAITIG